MPEPQTHRLTDIVTEEVSLVDRAANKRKFLVAKADGETSMLIPDGRGGFTRVSKSETDDEQMKRRKAAEADDDGEKEARIKARMAEDDSEKEARIKANKSFYEVRQNRKRIFDNEDEEKRAKKRAATAKADATGESLVDELEDQIETMESLVDALEDHEGSEPDDVSMKKLLEVQTNLLGLQKKFGKPSVEKVGRKMAQARLEMFQKAMGDLQSLLNELMETAGSAKEHAAAPGDPAKPPTGFSPANPSDAPTGTAGTAGGVTKAQVEQITKAATDLGEIVKSQKTTIDTLKEQVRKLESSVPGSTSITVEKTAGIQSGDVSWPMDMNRPIDRTTVGKSESFLDND